MVVSTYYGGLYYGKKFSRTFFLCGSNGSPYIWSDCAARREGHRMRRMCVNLSMSLLDSGSANPDYYIVGVI